MKTVWEKTKEEILKSPTWIVNLDERDFCEFDEGNDDNITVIDVSTADVTESRFNILSKQIRNNIIDIHLNCSSVKLIMFIQFPLSAPVMMSEMNNINQLTDDIIPKSAECEIKWGLSPREDNVTRIVCAIK